MDSSYLTFALVAALVVVIIVLAARKSENSEPAPPYQFQLLPLSRMIAPTIEDNLETDRQLDRDLAPSIDLFSTTPSPDYVLDQGIWGSCTAFSGKYAYYFYMHRPGNVALDISPAFLYAESRILGGFGLADVGSTNTATANVFSRTGVVSDTSFPYWAKNIFINPRTVPGLVESAGHKCTFTSIPFSSLPSVTLTRIKTALQTGPVIVGISVFRSHMTTSAMQTGVWGMPTAADLKAGAIGGHSICITGYTNTVFKFHNSWGVYCGLGGKFTLPLEYLTQVSNGKPSFATDMWTV